MRFSAAANILFAGAVMAGGEADQKYTTVTDVETITSCAPTVTDCPGNHASATAVSSSAWTASGSWSSSSSDIPTYTAIAPSGSSSWDIPTYTAVAPSSSSWTTVATVSQGPWTLNGTGSSLPMATGTGSWTDCVCEDVPDCTSSVSAGPTGGSGSSGNGSVSLSSPTSVVVGSANAAAPAFLAVVAGLVAFLA